MTETDSVSIRYERQLSKSRPRPGHSQSPANALLAPPPSQNKNNAANDSPDLISFSSPPPEVSKTVADDIFDRNFSPAPKYLS